MPATAAEVWAWHERPGAFARLLPPWERAQVVAREGEGLAPGTRLRVRTRIVGRWNAEWTAEHVAAEPGKGFRDVARGGPFTRWEHGHEFLDTPDGGCELRDRVEYALPGGAAGDAAAGAWVGRRLERLFAYRHATTRDDLAFARDHADAPGLRVLVSGATGLIGRALIPFLTTQGHEVVRLVRREPGMLFLPEGGAFPHEPWWDPTTGEIELGRAGRIDAVVHLAGAGVADARWTDARRRVLRDSRIAGTRLLAEALARLPEPPAVVIGASGVGYYGDSGDAWVDESGAAGRGFLAELCREWEAAWAPLDGARTRRVLLRTGLVLTPAGGALGRMAPVFSLGLGGRIGSGRQWCPWISIDDLVGVIGHALVSPGLAGPVNAVAPEPVTNAEFARTLGEVLRRPAMLPAPVWALRLAFGRGLADEALLTGQRARPAALARDGHRFRHEKLETALRHVLGRVA